MNALSVSLTKLAVALQVLSVVLAAPAVYEILPAPEPTQAEIRALISETAKKHSVSQVLALSIVQCESNFDYKARSKQSSAKGTAQFINSTWKETIRRMDYPSSSNVFDPKIHVEAFIWLLSEDGVSHWESSRKCWERML